MSISPTNALQYLFNPAQASTPSSATALSGATNTGAATTPFANLNLTSSEQSQIAAILQGANGLSFAQLEGKIDGVLSPAQQQTFQNDLAALRSHHGGHHGHGGGSDASSSTDTATDAFGVPYTSAATPAATAGASLFSDIAAQFAAQSQLQAQDPLAGL